MVYTPLTIIDNMTGRSLPEVNENKEAILLVGGSSFIGQQIASLLHEDEWVSTYRNHKIEHGVFFDSTTLRIEQTVDMSCFSHAVLLLGESSTYECESNPERTQKTNVDSVIEVLKSCKIYNVVPVFISTDGVFDGQNGNYKETDMARPVTTYGRQKLEVEAHIENHFDKYIILRTGKVYSSSRKHPTFISRWLTQLETGERVKCAIDHRFNPVHVDDFSAAVVGAIKEGLSGLYHAGGPMETTYCELLQLLLNFSPKLNRTAVYEKVLINDFARLEERPINTTINSERLYSYLGIKRKTPEEVCRHLCGDLDA